jgi:deoxycytidylate deaminase
MNNGRSRHTTSVLTNGKVLVAGGYNDGPLDSAELYDPLTETWRITDNMNHTRDFHTVSVLTNGKALITGGYNGVDTLNGTELYDPSTETWTTTGSMNNP